MKKLYFALAALLLLVSCGKSADREVFADYATSIRVSSTENVLRFAIDLEFTRPCTFRILYWKDSEGEASAKSTKLYTAQAGHQKRLLKFLYPGTAYSFKVEANGKSSQTASFTTGNLPIEVPVYHVETDNGGPEKGLILQWQAAAPGYITFCDMAGQVVWYERFDQEIRQAYYDPSREEMSVLTGFKDGYQICDNFYLINLDGERLIGWKASASTIEHPHHDSKILPDGNIIILHKVIKNYDLTPIGGEADTPLWGDGFTILDREGKVLKTWDMFADIDPIRDTYLDAVNRANDLVHANSVNWDSEGNFYVTFNHHSEIWKVDGETGKVLWRFGEHGNLSFDGDWPQGGLHAVVPLEPNKVLCYNNGAGTPPTSAAQIYKINGTSAVRELNVKTATEYSSKNRSNVELLPDGKTLMFGSTLARKCVFTDLEGNVLKVISRSGVSYRAHWFEEISF